MRIDRLIRPGLLKSLVLVTLSLATQIVGAQTVDSPVETVSYALRHRKAEEITRIFRPMIEGSPEVTLRKIEADDRLVLTGPAWSHELLETVLRRMDQRQPVAPVPNNPPTAQSATQATATLREPSSPAPVRRPVAPVDYETSAPLPNGSKPNTAAKPQAKVRQSVAIPAGTSQAVHQELTQLLPADSVRPAAADGRNAGQPGRALWIIETTHGPVRIECDPSRNDIYVDGPAVAVDQVARMVDAISKTTARQNGGNAGDGLPQKVVRVPRAVQADVQSMMKASRQVIAEEAAQSPADAPGRKAADPNATTADPVRVGPFRFAANQVDPAGTEPPAPPAEDDDTRADSPGTLPDLAGTLPGDIALPQLEGIDIETLPDLDAIILRGRNRDIDQLAEIIRQLELLSRQTQPVIEIVPLNHSDSAGIAEVIEQTQENLIGTRQGRATVLPLGKPNAILLIGWGEAVKAIQELIDKLDQPVRPETQFSVFRLKHATATTIQQTLETFFDNRPAEMSPTILSTVDLRTNSIVVHASPRDLDEVARLIASLDTPQGDAIHQTRVFEIRNSLADDIATTLRQAITTPTGTQRGTAMELLVDDDLQQQRVVSGILENIQITVNPRKNSLIISAPPNNFDLIEALIRQLDSEGTVAKIKIFPIQNGDAASLVETLRSLIPSQVGTGAPSVQLSVAPGGSSMVPLRFTVDVRSNSIIATGSEGDLRIVDALVLRLDESDAMQRRNTVYQLKNAPAVDVALAINEFLRNTRQVEAAGPGSANPFQQLEKEVVVVPEPVSNKLVLSATPRYFEEIEALIEKLDEQPPQVMIQVLIAEVTLGNAEEFGVELGLQDSVLFDRSLLGDLTTLTQTAQQAVAGGGVVTATEQVIVGATNLPGFNFNNQPLGNSGSNKALSGAGNVGGQGLSSFAVGRSNDELGFGGLVMSASSQNVNVLLRALEESRRLQVLSRPQILTLDNQPAFIQVGQRVPRIVASSLNQIGQQNSIALENVGLILGVTPRISPEGNVVMEIDAEKSEVGPESEGIPISISNDGSVIRSPRVNVASAQATVSAGDGETIILGGLITNSQREIHRKLPILGDIPVIKYLFRFDSLIEKRTELLIVLTPRVVRTPEDAERLKQVEMARMSWCAADVFDMHGDVFINDDMWHGTHEEPPLEVIFPHENPRGEPNRGDVPYPVESAPDYPIEGDQSVLPESLPTPLPTPPPPPPLPRSTTGQTTTGQTMASPVSNRTAVASKTSEAGATESKPIGAGLRKLFNGGAK
jgi:type II secretion system protein D